MFVTNSLTGGGAERAINLVCNGLVAEGFEVYLVPVNSGEDDLITQESTVIPLNRKWRSGFIETFIAFLRFSKAVRKIRPDLVVLNCDLPETLGALYPFYLRIVCVEHTNNSWFTRKKLGYLVRLILQVRGAKWVAVSDHISVWPLGAHPTVVIQNPLAPLKRENIHEGINTLRRLVFIGRLSQEKQPDLALDIAFNANREILFFGSGSMRVELESRANETNVQATFFGHVKNPWAFIDKKDLLIVTSKFEGDGLVVLEALQVGQPLLLHDIPEFRRFNLPDHHYCSTLEEFTYAINLFSSSLQSLNAESFSTIVEERELGIIQVQWAQFLRGML
jgi:GalNAc-alpha-(1->4)-GalNAc-alpha-(1->3)-diNAcBac-PP-undecaprenol alpha-1,4-N-acetyl-D-galactosaminyltransferase